MQKNERLIFAHFLRGLAALLVVCWHFGAVFWGTQTSVSVLLTIPAQTFHLNPVYLEIRHFFNLIHLDLGAFGVALFFLISGFVIAASLDNISLIGFTIGRIFRIYPTYIVGFSFSLLSLLVIVKHYHLPFVYGHAAILANYLLIYHWINVPGIDGVSWTLVIELLFYMWCVVLSVLGLYYGNSSQQQGRMSKALLFIIMPIISISISYFFNPLQTLGVSTVPFIHQLFWIVYDGTFITYMLIGTCIYNYYRCYWQLKKMLLMAGLLLFLFMFQITRPGFPSVFFSYFFALVLFSLFYYFRTAIPNVKFFSWLGDISYPLYVVHPLVGYASMTLLFQYTHSMILAFCLALVVAMSLAYGIHKTVELPTNQFGKRLAKKIVASQTDSEYSLSRKIGL